ncbi:MAG: glycerophosphodiester phosphodiesterase [Crocinitomicaceae bacterium]
MIFNRSVLFLFTLLLFYSCRKATICRDIEVYGHAAMGLSMPNSGYHANSLEAISLASEFPTLKGIELDVRMSKDGELWLFHDDFLEDETTGEGCIEEKISSEIEGLNYKSFHKEKLVRLSSLEIDSSKQYILDLKFNNACQQNLVNIATYKQALELLWKPNILLILPSKNLLSNFSSNYHCMLSSDNIELLLSELTSNEWYGCVIRNSKISEEQVRDLLDTGKKVYLYDIRSPKGTLTALKKRPSGIITDDVMASQSICN